MGFLDKVTSGKIKHNDVVCALGPAGAGKSTLACSWPKVIVADYEDGTTFLDVKRLPVAKTYSEAVAQIKELISSDHGYETLVVDTLDKLESMVNEETAKENGWRSIEDPAFGKGYAAAHQKWLEFIELLRVLRKKMNIVLVCHSTIKRASDPRFEKEYERHDFKLRDKTAALFKEYCDTILFCTYEIHLKDSASGKTKAIGDGARVMYTQSRPSHEAKNREGLPYRLPLDYEALQAARVKAEPEKPESMMARISECLEVIKDVELRKKVDASIKAAGTNSIELSRILNKLIVIAESNG